MSSKKSDIPPPTPADAGPRAYADDDAAPGVDSTGSAVAALEYKPPQVRTAGRRLPPWARSLLVNAWVPLALLSLVPLGRVVEDGERVDPYYARVVILIGI